jgi:hypothetical protein
MACGAWHVVCLVAWYKCRKHVLFGMARDVDLKCDMCVARGMACDPAFDIACGMAVTPHATVVWYAPTSSVGSLHGLLHVVIPLEI